VTTADIFGLVAGLIGILNIAINVYVYRYEHSPFRYIALTCAIIGVFAASTYVLVSVGPSLGWFERGTYAFAYRGSSAIVEGLLLVQGVYILRVLKVLKHGLV
jgi:hypothetical protein